MRIHLDTDLASDPDDVCALALLLGWPDVEITGVTTSDDPGGRRVGYTRHCLALAGRDDIPIAGGAELSMTRLRTCGGIPDDHRFWPEPVGPVRTPAGAALDLLDESIDAGATIAVIGPFTNLAQYELARPGRLARVRVVVMGGFVDPPGEGCPAWEASRDYNVQCDTRAAEILFHAAGDLTLVTLASTALTSVRERDLPRLRASGPLGRLIAAQAEAQATDYDNRSLGAAHDALPDDLLNFNHDSLACAVAARWTGTTLTRRRLRPAQDADGVLRFDDHPDGRPVDVVTAFDDAAFSSVWLEAVDAAQRALRSPPA